MPTHLTAAPALALLAVLAPALAPAPAGAFDIVPLAELCGAVVDRPTAVPRREHSPTPLGEPCVITVRDRASLLIAGASVSVDDELRIVLVNGGALEIRWSSIGAYGGLTVDGAGDRRGGPVRIEDSTLGADLGVTVETNADVSARRTTIYGYRGTVLLASRMGALDLDRVETSARGGTSASAARSLIVRHSTLGSIGTSLGAPAGGDIIVLGSGFNLTSVAMDRSPVDDEAGILVITDTVLGNSYRGEGGPPDVTFYPDRLPSACLMVGNTPEVACPDGTARW